MNNLPENKATPELEQFYPPIPRSTLDELNLAVQIFEDDAAHEGHKGYLSRVFTQVCLPYRDPLKSDPNAMVWHRRNGDVSLTIEPRIEIDDEGNVTRHFAYGKYPRLILPWMTTQIITAERDGRVESGEHLDISVGDSLREFFYQLGIPWGGKQGKDVRQQLENLLASRFVATLRNGNDDKGRIAYQSFNLSNTFDLWWGRESDIEGQGTLFGSSIRLSPEFVQGVLEAPVPVDLRAIALLAKHGAFAMDIYTWFAHRLPAAKKSTLIKWETLKWQFGGQYTRLRDFKAKFISHLPAVHQAYPGAKFMVRDEGLLIHPSAPSVARTVKKITSPPTMKSRELSEEEQRLIRECLPEQYWDLDYPASLLVASMLSERLANGWSVQEIYRMIDQPIPDEIESLSALAAQRLRENVPVGTAFDQS